VVGAAGGQPEPVVAADQAYALSPDGQTLAFLKRSSDFASVSIWISSPPGAEPKHYGPAPFEGATHDGGGRLTFSPDGKQILLWSRFLVRGPEFWLLPYPAGTGQPRRVLEQARDAYVVRGFSWIPGSRRIVFAAALPPATFRSHLYIGDVDSGVIHLLVGGIGSESFPTVSPDGKQIAYSQMEYDSSIVEIPLDGSAPRSLVTHSRLEHSPVWSPRGREFAYVTDRDGVDEIMIRNVDTGREQPVVTPRNFPSGESEFLTTPVFSPEGDRIAFVRHNNVNAASRDICEVWISPSAGGPAIRIADSKGDQWAPTWSPDGTWIAFVSQGPPSAIMKARVGGNGIAETVWQMDLSVLLATPEWSPRGDWIATASQDGTMLLSPDGKSRRILRKPAFLAATWSRDGSVLYGLEESGGGQRIIAANIDRPGEREVSRIPDGLTLRAIWYPGRKMSLSPDSRSLAATSIREGGSIWMLDNFETAPWWQRLFRH
jgi:Tol biopolymer transport system component